MYDMDCLEIKITNWASISLSFNRLMNRSAKDVHDGIGQLLSSVKGPRAGRFADFTNFITQNMIRTWVDLRSYGTLFLYL
jgi:hypothetical protein